MTIFDTFDIDPVATAPLTFSNGNLTVLGGAGLTLTNSGIAQSVEGKTVGKWYAEFTVNAVSGNVDGIGVIPCYGIGNGGFIGGTSTSAASFDCGIGFYSNGNITQHGSTQTSVNNTSYTVGDVVGIALDMAAGKIWFRKNTGAWIGTTGTPNPSSNNGGFTISHTVTAGRVFIGVNLSGSAAQFTANFGSTAFTGAIPSGFSGWTNTTAGTYFGSFATSARLGSGPVSAPPQNNKAVSPYISNFTGPLGSVIFAFAGGSIPAAVLNLKAVVYDSTGVGGLPGNLLGTSANTIISGPGGEVPFYFNGIYLTSGIKYWFGFVSSGASNASSNTIFGVPLTNGIVFNTGPYPTPSSSFGASPSTSNSRYPLLVYPINYPMNFYDWTVPKGKVNRSFRDINSSTQQSLTDLVANVEWIGEEVLYNGQANAQVAWLGTEVLYSITTSKATSNGISNAMANAITAVVKYSNGSVNSVNVSNALGRILITTTFTTNGIANVIANSSFTTSLRVGNASGIANSIGNGISIVNSIANSIATSNAVGAATYTITIAPGMSNGISNVIGIGSYISTLIVGFSNGISTANAKSLSFYISTGNSVGYSTTNAIGNPFGISIARSNSNTIANAVGSSSNSFVVGSSYSSSYANAVTTFIHNGTTTFITTSKITAYAAIGSSNTIIVPKSVLYTVTSPANDTSINARKLVGYAITGASNTIIAAKVTGYVVTNTKPLSVGNITSKNISNAVGLTFINYIGSIHGISRLSGNGFAQVVTNFVANQVSIKKIQLRRGTEAELSGIPKGFPPTVFPKGLDAGEIIFTTDSSRVIVGHDPNPGDVNYQRLVFPYQNIEVLTETSPRNKELFNISLRNQSNSSYIATNISGNYNGPITYSDVVNPPIIPTILYGSSVSAIISYHAFSYVNSVFTPLENGRISILSYVGNSTISNDKLTFGSNSLIFALSSIQYDVGGHAFYTVNVNNLTSNNVVLHMRRIMVQN